MTPPAPKPNLDEIARSRIRAWITSTGVTQTDLSARIGRNQAWMSRYLKGEFAADLDTLQAIAQVFGHTLAALLNLPTDPDEAKIVEQVRALRAKDRVIVLDLLQALTRSHRTGRRARR